MTPIDWLSLLHPVLVILFIYPVVGATIRLGILVRERRLGITQQPAAVPREHADHGAWITVGAVVAVLIALAYSCISHAVEAPDPGLPAGSWGWLLLAAGTIASLVALVRQRRAPLRGCFALLTWAGLLILGSQPGVWRVSDNPLTAGFWNSHYWGGTLLCGLLLATTAARPAIIRRPAWRRLHLGINLLILVLLAAQAISGSRDLLEIPLSWQKPLIFRCDPVARTCPGLGMGTAAPGLPLG